MSTLVLKCCQCLQVVLILGVAGACRCGELVHLRIDDIEDVKSALLVKIPNSKTKKARSFTVMGEMYLSIYRKYVALRPKNFEERRFFIKYQGGICHRIVVGIHKISNVAQEVAKYLNLENASEYTGHCLRRTSATFLVDSGGDLTCLKRHGGWKSNTVAEGYIEESIANKKDIAKKILGLDEPSTNKIITPIIDNNVITADANNKQNAEAISGEISSLQDPSTSVTSTDVVSNITRKVNTVDRFGLFNFHGSSNCTFNINITN